jgi:peptidoglycan hydrolase-like protein with peptidoglycan-binding domain
MRRRHLKGESQMIKKIFLVLALSLSAAFGIFAQGPDTSPSAAKSSDTAKKPTFRSTKDQVKEAQTLLKSKKMFDGEATGTSSNEWKAAVKAYQGANGLAKTGSLNRATLEKMEIKLTDKQKDIPVDPKHIASADEKPKKPANSDSKSDAKTSTGPKRPAPFSATADQITALQTKLKEAKLFMGEANGKRSDDLKAAVKKYQENNSLKMTGGINAETLEKMGIPLTDKQKEQVAAQAAYDAAKKN